MKLSASSLSLALAFALATPYLAAGTPLSNAVISGDPSAVYTCLAGGEALNELDKWGWTPLLWAVYYQQDEMITLLLERGADPNVQAKKPYRRGPVGTTALTLAVLYEREDYAEWIMKWGGDPLVKDGNGGSAQDYASEKGNPSMVRIVAARRQVPTAPAVIGRERLADVLVILDSDMEKSDDLLAGIRTALDRGLTERKVRHAIFVRDRLFPECDEQLANLKAAFKPKTILTLLEVASEDRNDPYHRGERIRSYTSFKVKLASAAGGPAIWAQTAKAGYRRGMLSRGVDLSLKEMADNFSLGCLSLLTLDHLL